MLKLAQLLQLAYPSWPGLDGRQISHLAYVIGWQMSLLANVRALAGLGWLGGNCLRWQMSLLADVIAPAGLGWLGGDRLSWEMSQVDKCHCSSWPWLAGRQLSQLAMSQVGKCHCSNWLSLIHAGWNGMVANVCGRKCLRWQMSQVKDVIALP